MANDNSVTLVGNITRDPELRFTNTGQPTATFGLAVNRRWQNRQTQEWEEATSFFDVVCWREMAENVSESLARGSRVVVAGRLEQRSWETPDGDKRSKVEVVADEIGPSLRWATAQVTKNDRRGPSDGSRGGAEVEARGRCPRRIASRGASRLWIRRGAVLMARSNYRGGTSRRAPKDLNRRVKKKPCAMCRDHIELGRLQGRAAAPQVHERPGQDPLAPGHGQLCPAPAGHRDGHQDGARAGAAAVHPAHRDRAPGRARRARWPRGRPRRPRRRAWRARRGTPRAFGARSRPEWRGPCGWRRDGHCGDGRRGGRGAGGGRCGGCRRVGRGRVVVMRVVLRDDVDGVGRRGDIVDVSGGFAPELPAARPAARSWPPPASKRRLHRCAGRATCVRRETAQSAEAQAQVLAGAVVMVPARAGSRRPPVRLRDLLPTWRMRSRAQKGVELDRRHVELDEPIKAVGTVEVPVHLFTGVTTILSVEVIGARLSGPRLQAEQGS